MTRVLVSLLAVCTLAGCIDFIWTDDQPTVWNLSPDPCAPKSVESCGALLRCPYVGLNDPYNVSSCVTGGVMTDLGDGSACLYACSMHAGRITKDLYNSLNDCLILNCNGWVEYGIPWVFPTLSGAPSVVWNFNSPCIARVTGSGGACAGYFRNCDNDPSFRSTCSTPAPPAPTPPPDMTAPRPADMSRPKPVDMGVGSPRDATVVDCRLWALRNLSCSAISPVKHPPADIAACYDEASNNYSLLSQVEQGKADAVLSCARANSCGDAYGRFGAFTDGGCVQLHCASELKACDPGI